MKVSVIARALVEVETQAIVLTVFETESAADIPGLSPEQNSLIARLRNSGELSGRFKEFTLIHLEGCKAEKLLIMGLGKREEFSLEKLMAVSAVSARNLRRIKVERIAYANNFEEIEDLSLADTAQAIVEGVTLGLYRFDKYISGKKTDYMAIKELQIVVRDLVTQEIEESASRGEVLSRSTNMARDLVNEPACYMTPSAFAEAAVQIAGEFGMKIKVLAKEELIRENMHALLAVNAGSAEPARMVVMEYDGGRAEDKVLGLVGKGITFDSGGLSLKSHENMYRMHCDMAGAAAVLCAMRSMAANRLPINAVAVMPLTENLVDANSYKVGDIIKTREGKTVEILNTDAEGRLILADALSYIRSYRKIDYLVDIATLTGSIVYALGHFCIGAMTNSGAFYKHLKVAGVHSSEKVWQMPLFEEYKTQIKSDVADLENTGGSPAGSITAAIFLKEFVGDTPWVHLDIAGTAWMDESIQPYMKAPFLPREGATGSGTRLLYSLAEQLVGQPTLKIDLR